MLAGWFAAEAGTPAPDLSRALPGTTSTVELGGRGAVVHDQGPQAVGRSGDWTCVLEGALWERPEGPSDAEVLAREWARAGDAGLYAMKGEWLAVLFDERRRRALLACDPSGARTAFFSISGQPCRFATELAPLLALFPTRPEPDEDIVAALLRGRSAEDGRTALRGVSRLGFGGLVELDGGQRRWRRWYRLEPEAQIAASPGEAAELLRDGVARAIEVRAPATEPTAVSLSGGLDSSTVAAVAHWRRSGREDAAPLRAYSAVFPGDSRMDESDHVVALREALGLPGVALRVAPSGLLRGAAAYIERWQSPIDGPGFVLDEAMMGRAAADGMRVALDGQGGDETFGASGYLIADRLKRLRLISALRLAKRQPRYGAEPGLRTIALLLDHYGLRTMLPPRLHAWLRRRRAQPAPVPSWFAPEWAGPALALDDAWAWKEARTGVPRWWAFHVANLTEGREASGLADYSRRRAAPHGLAGRPPLLDADLIRLVLRLPPETAFDPVLDRALMREGLRGLAPDSVRLRVRKTRLGAFYSAGLLADLPAVRRLLGSSETLVRRYTVESEVRRLLDDPRPVGEQGWTTWLEAVWGLAAAELWLRAQEDPAFPGRVAEEWGLSQPASEGWWSS